MENKEIIETVEELQTTFNTDSIDNLVEDGTVENVATVETDGEVAE